MPQDKQLYLPVLVGANKNWHEGIDYQQDNDGINISDKNPYYSELTAIYWAWKNLDMVDAVGLVHYRRFFLKGLKKRKIENVLSKKQVEVLLTNADIVLPKMRKYYIETNYSHYIHAHHSKPLDVTRIVISKYHPDYLESFDGVMKRRSAHMFNMFVMKKKFFNAYCEWLFSILNYVDSDIDLHDYSVQEKRVFGYLAELLLDVWMTKNKYSYVEVRWGMLGKKHTLAKAISLVKRKLGRKTKTHF